MELINQKPKQIRDSRYLDHQFIPERECLVGLENQLKELGVNLSQIFYMGSADPTLIWGPTGTGKTTIMKIMETELIKAANKNKLEMFISYSINARTAHNALLNLTHNSGINLPKRGIDFHTMLNMYQNKFQKRFNIFIVDEIQKIKDLDDLLYELTRRRNILLIGITTDVFFSDLVKSPSVKSTFVESKQDIMTRSYELNDIIKILDIRIKKAFVEDFISDDVRNNIAGHVASRQGNIRFGLDILKRIGKLIPLKNITKPDTKLIDKLASHVEREHIDVKLEGLNYQQKCLLYSFYVKFRKTRKLEGERVAYPDLYQVYSSIIGHESYSYKHTHRLLDDLSDLGFIRIKTTYLGKNKGRITEIWPRYNTNWGLYYNHLKEDFDKIIGE